MKRARTAAKCKSARSLGGTTGQGAHSSDFEFAAKGNFAIMVFTEPFND